MSGTVTLAARFDAGYFVIVHLGRHEFRGMLYYHPQEEPSHPVRIVFIAPNDLSSVPFFVTHQGRAEAVLR